VKAVRAVLVAVALASCPTTAHAQTTTFGYTGTEQAYMVPDGYEVLHVTAVGAPGGLSGPRPFPMPIPLFAGRGGIVEGDVPADAGRVLYVVVGGNGGLPDGGFNGGGRGASRQEWAVFGGGGASDIRTLPTGQGAASLDSRIVVAAGGGGAPGPGTDAGDAGFAGGAAPESAQAGTQTEGGSGGSCGAAEGCGTPGAFGIGGEGGASGEVADGTLRLAGGGGGGWYGGGGGPARELISGGGAGGSSRRPGGGTFSLASRETPPQVQITPIRAPLTLCSNGTDNDADGLADYPDDPGCEGVWDEDEWNADTSAPRADLSAPRTQKLGRWVTLEVNCRATAEDCIVSATGAVIAGRAARAYQLNRFRSAVVRRGQSVTLRLGVPKRVRATAGKALRSRGRAHAQVNVRVADETGNVSQLPGAIRLVRGSR
jgi:Glycine rich protein